MDDKFIEFFLFVILMYFLYLGIRMYLQWRAKNAPPSIERPNYLGCQIINDKLKAISVPPSQGILAPSLPSERKFYVSTSDRGLVIGPPGTGKTSFLVNQIYEWSNTGNSLVCLDIKPEIASLTRKKLEEKGYNIIIYNPVNLVDTYDFLQDLDGLEAVGELTTSLIPTYGGENDVFNHIARDLLNALINHSLALYEDRVSKGNGKDYEKPTLPTVYDLMTKYDSTKALFNDLKHSKSPMTRQIINSLSMTAENERLIGSIIATFSSNLNFLKFPHIRESLNGGFSLSELLKPKTALFLQFEEANMSTISHLFSVFVGHLLRYLIVNHKNRGPVFCLLDEIGNAGIISGLTEKLNTIRSRNMPTWMYWQSVEQMEKYGNSPKEGANIIMGACDFQMCFRLNDTATADYFRDRVGTQLVETLSSSIDSENLNSVTKSLDREDIIFSHEFQQLGDSEVVAIYRGIPWKGIAVPYWKIEQRNKFNTSKPKINPVEPEVNNDNVGEWPTSPNSLSLDEFKELSKGYLDKATKSINEAIKSFSKKG